MEDKSKSLFSELIKTFLFIGMLLGTPIYFITNKYDVYESIEQNAILNQLNAWGFIIAIIATPVILLIIKALFRNTKPNLFKRITWGLLIAIPIFITYMFSNWISNNIDFIKSMLQIWSITTALSFVLAPNYVIKYYQERK